MGVWNPMRVLAPPHGATLGTPLFPLGPGVATIRHGVWLDLSLSQLRSVDGTVDGSPVFPKKICWSPNPWCLHM